MAETSNRKTYHEQTYIDNTLRLREILKTLPPFAKDYFRAVEPTTSARTRISYAYDIRVFFHFLMENNPVYKNYTIEKFEVHDLERLEHVDIEEYQECSWIMLIMEGIILQVSGKPILKRQKIEIWQF